MKKIIACGLLLTMLGSLGTLCFASGYEEVELIADYAAVSAELGKAMELGNEYKNSLNDYFEKCDARSSVRPNYKSVWGWVDSPEYTEWKESSDSLKRMDDKLHDIDRSLETVISEHESPQDEFYNNTVDGIDAVYYLVYPENSNLLTQKLEQELGASDFPSLHGSIASLCFLNHDQRRVFLEFVDDSFNVVNQCEQETSTFVQNWLFEE